MRSTDAHSPGYCRELEAAEFLRRQGWTILLHNVEIAHVQVDLVARDRAGHLALIEVKSYSEAAHLPRAQARRLARVADYLSSYEAVDIFLAFVQGGTSICGEASMCGERVEILPVDGLTDF